MLDSKKVLKNDLLTVLIPDLLSQSVTCQCREMFPGSVRVSQRFDRCQHLRQNKRL